MSPRAFDGRTRRLILICGVQSPGEPHCTLPAGHAGVHESTEGMFKNTWFGGVWFYLNGQI